MTLRKGQKIANWIRDQGYTDRDARRILFNMSEDEFEEAVNFDGPYSVNPKSLWNKDGVLFTSTYREYLSLLANAEVEIIV